MGRVCLIVPVASASVVSEGWVRRCRKGLEGAGHHVRILAVVAGEVSPPVGPVGGACEWIASESRGLSSAAMRGLAEAEAVDDWLVVIDPTQGYHPDDLPLMVAPLARGAADLVVAVRKPGSLSGGVSRAIFGASDPLSGLVAVSAARARQVCRGFNPVGSRFAVDLLFRSQGRKAEVPIRAEGRSAPIGPRFDDVRHLKRLADDRLGNASRLIQFCAVGASGMVVDLSAYAAFQLVFSRTRLASLSAPLAGGSLDLAAAGALAIGLALTWNFSLNRRLTFNYARQGSLVRQYVTYALSNALGIALSFSLRLYLPAHVGFFRRHRLAAAAVGIVAATGISFTMSRWLVFRRRNPVPPPPHCKSGDARASSSTAARSKAAH